MLESISRSYVERVWRAETQTQELNQLWPELVKVGTIATGVNRGREANWKHFKGSHVHVGFRVRDMSSLTVDGDAVSHGKDTGARQISKARNKSSSDTESWKGEQDI